MNKQEAADYLRVSVRALERYVSQGKISVRYEKGKTRPTANFDEQELEQFKAELTQPTYKPRQIPTPSQQPEETALTYSGEISEFGEVNAIDKLAGIIEKLLQREFPVFPVADKLLLTISGLTQIMRINTTCRGNPHVVAPISPISRVSA